MSYIDPTELDLNEETVVKVRRVSKVVAGGRRFRFSATVVVGDGNGHVGLGHGKSNEVLSSITKAKEDAKKNLFRVPIIKGTIPHQIMGKFGASKVLLKPASPGTGIIAGGPIRALMQQSGITDILTKRYGSSNANSIIRAAERGLISLQDPVSIANKRGITISEIFK
ncbi:MAG: 30S ribosomal protein S5 [Candidatus Marinimicrobia bacterium]|nr:30S ribosomal protein S5 [Candidatus Neomarinimicrobiota bacterium]MBL7046369.1 30S ribosomal protein S5 [Candidatus Neomarinimicrobiota bacterium]